MTDTSHFKLADEGHAREAAQRLFVFVKTQLAAQLPPQTEILHVGATAIPGCLTKGDLDIVVRVPAGHFAAADRTLAASFERNQDSIRTAEFSAFEDAFRHPPLGIQLVARDGPFDFFHMFIEALRRSPSLVEEYNQLKLRHEGVDMARYRAAKDQFIERTLAQIRASPPPFRLLNVEDVLRLTSYVALFGSQFDIDPSGRWLAVSVHKGIEHAPRYCVPFLAGGELGELHLFDLETKAVHQIQALTGVGLFSPLWSPDGQRLAVTATDGSFVRPCVVDAESGIVRTLSERNIGLLPNKHPFHWIGNEELACRLLEPGARPMVLDVEYRGAEKAMAAWSKAWKGKTVTASALRSDAAEIHPVSLWGGGEPMVISIADGRARGFVEGEEIPETLIFRIEEPEEKDRPEQPAETEGLPPLSTKAASHPASGRTVFLSRGNDGTRFLLRGKDSDELTTLFETDCHLSAIRPGEIHLLEYRHPSCGEQRMRCILPPDHETGQRRPAVLWVYPGQRIRDNPTALYHINNEIFFNLQLLAARGYVVLAAAMPTEGGGLDQRPIIETLPEAALAAVKAADEAGWIDREQVHLLGQSLGGWAVMSLLTETSAFRSGIAMAGIYNFIGLYGQFDVRFRYEDWIGEFHVRPKMIETFFRLSEPPWKNPQPFLRNSPLFAVERISTPVIMFHGDQDYVPIAQAEEMFTALRFAGKKAEFVRYWGEGHVLSSPANIRDAWSRIFKWLASFDGA